MTGKQKLQKLIDGQFMDAEEAEAFVKGVLEYLAQRTEEEEPYATDDIRAYRNVAAKLYLVEALED